MNCQSCSEDKNIVWRDWCGSSGMNGSTSISIRVCYDCLVMMEWEVEIKELLPQVVSCGECNQKFIPKKQSQTKCGICWKGFFKRRENGSN